MTKVKHLVVDSGAFIKNAPVHEYAENIYTVSGVVKEIKDTATRQRLQFLPYDLKVKDPFPDAYKHVLEFSKKTGDFACLSTVDLQIIALTYQLEKENVGTNHLNTEPSCTVTGRPCFADTQLSGFFYPEKTSKISNSESTNDSYDSDEDCNTEDQKQSENGLGEESKESLGEHDETIINQDEEVEKSEDSEEGTDSDEDCNTVDQKKSENGLGEESKESLEHDETIINHDEEIEESEDSEEESDSEEGWITSDNIVEMQKKMGAMLLDENATVNAACISTDFSVQNVLIQMGLHILSVDGMIIKNARVFILRCFACYKTTTNMDKKFCPNCGNRTLKRVAVSYDENGFQNIHINFRKPINIRGTRYTLPMPKGGRHVKNPILCEDQRFHRDRPSKMALQKTDALNPDYDSLSSPFALNDVNSRASSLGVRSNRIRNERKNPNVWSLRTGNKKKRK